MDRTGAYENEFSAALPLEGVEPAGSPSSALPRKSTAAISLVMIGSALFLANGLWYSGTNSPNRARGGAGPLFLAGGGMGYRGGSTTASIEGSARGGFGTSSAHVAG